jgi:hypothetical protein
MATRLGAPPRNDSAAAYPSNEFIARARREDDADLGFSVSEMRSVARRQLAGSIVVGLAIAAVTGLTALRPNHPQTSFASVHSFPVVEQPIIIRTERHLASKQFPSSGVQPTRESP